MHYAVARAWKTESTRDKLGRTVGSKGDETKRVARLESTGRARCKARKIRASVGLRDGTDEMPVRCPNVRAKEVDGGKETLLVPKSAKCTWNVLHAQEILLAEGGETALRKKATCVRLW